MRRGAGGWPVAAGPARRGQAGSGSVAGWRNRRRLRRRRGARDGGAGRRRRAVAAGRAGWPAGHCRGQRPALGRGWRRAARAAARGLRAPLSCGAHGDAGGIHRHPADAAGAAAAASALLSATLRRNPRRVQGI
ncbi:hypothetical protein CBM2604_B120215 [Cupriavidus taiwanensis]|nr:hypothetical protein CBM2604_B120215 [Cupriavidus taiwanensis]SOZ49769.1 hypothetical protein CBM2610_B90218 [Cupriavidus taiwanensis]